MFKHSRVQLKVRSWFAVRFDRAFSSHIKSVVTILQSDLPDQMWKQRPVETLAAITLRRLIDEENAAPEIALSAEGRGWLIEARSWKVDADAHL
jgi:hypothetical protein